MTQLAKLKASWPCLQHCWVPTAHVARSPPVLQACSTRPEGGIFAQSVGIKKHQFAVGREPSRHVFCSEMSNRNVGANECTPLQTTQVALMASLLLADFLPKANSLVHAHVLFVGIKITCYIWNSLTYVGWWSSEKVWWLLSSFKLGKYQFMCNFSLYSF